MWTGSATSSPASSWRAWIRPDTLARMRWHHDAGHDVVFVSASFGTYLRPLAETASASSPTCCPPSWPSTMTAAARAASSAPTAAGRRRCAACTPGWTSTRRAEAVEVWAYGDSPGDRELLADADRAVWVGDDVAGAAEAGTVTTWHGLLRTARPKQWVKNVLVFAAPGAAGVLDDWPQLGRTMLVFVAFCIAASGTYFWNDLFDLEADRLHPTKRFRPIAAGVIGVGRPHARRHRSARSWPSSSPPGQGTWKTVAVVGRVRRADDPLQRVAQARRRARPRRRRLRVRAAAAGRRGRRRRPDVELVRAVHRVRLAVHRHRQALRRAARDGRGGPAVRATLAQYSLGYLRIVLTVSMRRDPRQLLPVGLRDVGARPTPIWPFYELSIVPMLTALLRYVLVLEQGHGAAPGGGLRQRPGAATARLGLGDRVRAGGVPADELVRRGQRSTQAAVPRRRLDDATTRAAGCSRRPPDARPAGASSRSAASAVARRSCSRRPPAGGVEVVAIDPHAGNDRGPQEIEGYAAEAADDRAVFEANLAAAGVADRVRHVARVLSTTPTATSTTRSTCCTSTAPTGTGPARADIRDWGGAGRRRWHAADPRRVLVGRRDVGDRTPARSPGGGSATSGGRVRSSSTAPTCAGRRRRPTPPASWRSCRGSPATWR